VNVLFSDGIYMRMAARRTATYDERRRIVQLGTQRVFQEILEEAYRMHQEDLRNSMRMRVLNRTVAQLRAQLGDARRARQETMENDQP